jgi:TonB family protein
MKTLRSLSLIVLASCICVADQSRVNFHSDVLYFQNTEGGRIAAREIVALYGAKQKVQVVDQEIPQMQYPSLRYQVGPIYPAGLQKEGIKGSVIVDFILSESGNVYAAAVIKSTDPEFNVAALQAVQKWRFKPAEREGVAIRCHLQVPINFGIDK